MKRVGLIVGIVIVVAVFAGAAFFAAQLLNAPEQAAAEGPGGGQRVMEIVTDDGSGPLSLRITFEPAPELPDRPAETAGVFVKREDNSIFVGTGDIGLDIEVDETGKETIALEHSGPVVEVVVSQETVVYHDVTEIDIEPSARESGEKTIQQIVEPAASVEEIGENIELQVWGERRGDRIVAEVLVFREAR